LKYTRVYMAIICGTVRKKVDNIGPLQGGCNISVAFWVNIMVNLLSGRVVMHINHKVDRLIEGYKSRLPGIDQAWPADVKKVADYIHKNLFDIDLTIMSMYEQCNISNKNIAGKFSTYTGLTPKKYVLYHRIECSKQILEQIGKNDLPLIMLAMKLGFSTHSAFTRHLNPGPA
jgi:AraC-like DNA-binding protein